MSNYIRTHRTENYKKGIFCIEGLWTPDHRDKSSVKKALDFLELIEGVKTAHRNCINKLALSQLIDDSFQKRYSRYAILYLAFHGEPSKIVVEKRNKTVSLDEVADMIDGRANGRIIHFGSCRTLETDGWELRRFLKKTNALAVSGYTADVDFVRSSVFDLIYFQQCQTTTSIRKISEEMKRYYKNLGAELGFKIKDYR